MSGCTSETLDQDLALARAIVLDGLKHCTARVYLIGSAARGESRRSSDIDVGILPLAPLPTGLLAEIRERLEESNALRLVDVVDLSQTSPEFQRRALQEGVLWSD